MVHNNKKLTVAIPTYNRKEYLHETLESLDSQTFKDFQIIIFDNASDYDVNQFISYFPKLDIQISKNESNVGNLANFIKVINYDFDTPYVIVFHDDDTLHPSYFETAITFLEKNLQVVWVGSNIDFVKNEKSHAMQHFDITTSKNTFTELNQSELIKKLMRGFNLGFGSVIYQSETLKTAVIRTKEFDKWFDRPFMIDLASNKTVAITYGKFMNYRIHQNQDSQAIDPSKFDNVINLFQYYRERSNEKDTWIFKRLENNNSIISAVQNSKTFKELFTYLDIFKRRGFFSFKNIDFKGVYSFLKFIIKK